MKTSKIQPPKDIKLTADYDPAKLIWIPGTTTFISANQEFNGKTIKDAVYAAADNGLAVAGTSLFIPYLINVVSSANGKTTLYDGKGNPLSKKNANDLYERLTAGCWINLATYFKKNDDGHFHVETNYGITSKNRFQGLFGESVQSKVSPLEKCLMHVDDCRVDLDLKSFNKQGLAVKRSKDKEYQRGKNIHFYSPIDNAVSWFYADSGRAVLYCDGGQKDSFASLGVLVCAEGTPKN